MKRREEKKMLQEHPLMRILNISAMKENKKLGIIAGARRILVIGFNIHTLVFVVMKETILWS
jgi:hypothetical protein